MKRQVMQEDTGDGDVAFTTQLSPIVVDGLDSSAASTLADGSGLTASGEFGGELAHLRKISLQRLWPDVDPDQFRDRCLGSAALTVTKKRELLGIYPQLSHFQAKQLLGRALSAATSGGQGLVRKRSLVDVTLPTVPPIPLEIDHEECIRACSRGATQRCLRRRRRGA